MCNDVQGESHREAAGKMGECYGKESVRSAGPASPGALCGDDHRAPCSKRQSLRMGQLLARKITWPYTQGACLYVCGRWLFPRGPSEDHNGEGAAPGPSLKREGLSEL